jgi:hypothetical protein
MPRRLLFLLSLTTTALPGQQAMLPLDSLLRAHAEPISLVEGRLQGPGARRIIDLASATRFTILAEEHDLEELAELSVALFDTLQRGAGYQYLAVEQGRIITPMIAEAARAGGEDSVRQIVAAYPQAPTFASDAELRLLTHVAARSKGHHLPVWGVDQDLAAMHILDRLARLAPDSASAAMARRLAAEARVHEFTRFGDTHYLTQVAHPEAFDSLAVAFGRAGQVPGEVGRLLEALRFTAWIYRWNRTAGATPPTGHRNMWEREHAMKQEFSRHLRLAEALDLSPPKVIVKAGHWHTLRGFSPGHVPTFGSMVDALAESGGREALVITVHVVGSVDRYRNTQGALATVAPVDAWTVYDLRALRPWALAGRIEELPDAFREIVFSADLALVIGGGATGPRTWVR